MKRATARGRMLPQSLSTDPRMGRFSLKANLLFDRMWINCDDQGRISGDPDEIKYAACPNVDQITKADIPQLLEELQTQGLIKVYSTSRTKAVQMIDWWEEQKLQWAWPSRYPPPEGWKDRLRYKKSAKEVVTENWGSPENSPENSGENTPEHSPENSALFPLTTPLKKENGKRKRRGRGNSPESSGEKPSPSPAGFSRDELEILPRLTECFKIEWGRVPAHNPYTVIPREPTARESAQLRDLAKELSAAGGCPLDHINQAFREAAGQQKFHVSYVRAVLHAWLGNGRGPPR